MMWMDLIDIAINNGLDIGLNHDFDENITAQIEFVWSIWDENIIIIFFSTNAHNFPIVENCGELDGGNGLEWGDAGDVGKVIRAKSIQEHITPTQN